MHSFFIRYGARVRKPTAPEQLYIDFDGFFAACEEQADRRLQGRPLAVIPFAGAVQSCVIAANMMAKRAGVTTGMAIADARRWCPGSRWSPSSPISIRASTTVSSQRFSTCSPLMPCAPFVSFPID